MKIAVLGAGAWGTALAAHAAVGHDVVLWARDAAQAACIERERCNARYLGEVELPASLRASADLGLALAHGSQGLAVVATPMSGLRECLHQARACPHVVWLTKGFEASTGALGHEIARDLRPGLPGGVLSGPSFALEVARAQPTALVMASESGALQRLAVDAFHHGSVRVYTSFDPVGVEVGGALKNVLAIAAGILEGLGQTSADHVGAPGLNARAALITRGLAEMTRLGLALGARPETFMGLSGLGDLVLTATGALSRNRQVGLLLAQGVSLAQALQSLGHVAEGVYTAATAWRRARDRGVQMPITEAVVGVLEGRWAPAEAMAWLMAREARAEA